MGMTARRAVAARLVRVSASAGLVLAALVLASGGASAAVLLTAAIEPTVLNIPVSFLIFAATLAGVAIFHHHTLAVALTGLAAVILWRLLFADFEHGPGLPGLVGDLRHEWVTLANLLLLLLGFTLLSRHFEESKLPDVMPTVLPDNWTGGFALLVIVFVISSFLDNIAAALIGGTMARHVFNGRVHLGYLAAIVAASNAGGSGSVVGDTTTTMMWIAGVPPTSVLDAYVAAGVALVVCGVPAARTQQAYSPIQKNPREGTRIEWGRVAVVAVILATAIAANVWANLKAPELLDRLPVIGLAVWAALLLTALVRRPDWSALPEALKGTIFLLALVLSASLMPVSALPEASWRTALGLGFISAVFDNIPLTALALRQGGYDWGMLAYCVGFGGSMLWFGSSAGVALSNMYPEAKSAAAWLKQGWFVVVAYVVGFAVMLTLLGWHPEALPHKAAAAAHSVAVSGAAR